MDENVLTTPVDKLASAILYIKRTASSDTHSSSHRMTILLTGGTGKSATPLAKLLLEANQPVLLATRSGNVLAPFKGVQFDWFDTSTYKNPFEADSNIDRIYLIPPAVFDMFPPMKAFIDFAITKGVKRFVLMGSALLEAGDPLMGKVHEYLASLSVDYCVLRPSWFFGASGIHSVQKSCNMKP
jgi:uncharacterized protein YbjT (DUF2867 family)